MAAQQPPGPYQSISLASQPGDYDIAITSTSPSGGQGFLSDLVLNQYGYDRKALRSLDLSEGYGLLEDERRKPIVFVVTTGNNDTALNLETNLSNAVRSYLGLFKSSRVWLPLMGTGAGELPFETSYEIITNVLARVVAPIMDVGFHFNVSFPKEAERLYRELEAIYPKYGDASEEIKLEDPPPGATKHQAFRQKAADFDSNDFDSSDFQTESVEPLSEQEQLEADGFLPDVVYMVEAVWDGKDRTEELMAEGIWADISDSPNSEMINSVPEGATLLLKTTFTEGSNFLVRVTGVGTVERNTQNGNSLAVDWQIVNDGVDVFGTSAYPDAIAPLLPQDRATFGKVTSEPGWRIYGFKGKEETHTNVTTIAGLISDADVGADYLNIAKDVNAFARVIASKTFTPPLAIGLFGKWGSGKSFFMRKLMERIKVLSKTNPQDAFCEGIAHVHFNAWSYMDSNLWASMVTRIFEGLQQYISDQSASDEEVAAIEKAIADKLTMTQRELAVMESKKKVVEGQIGSLEKDKGSLEEDLKKALKELNENTVEKVLDEVDTQFQIVTKVEDAVKENPTMVENVAQFERIVPREHWVNAETVYEEVESKRAFLRSFFLPGNRMWNILSILGILAIIIGTPFLVHWIVGLVGDTDFSFPMEAWTLITVAGGVYVRGINTYNKYQPMVASFWRIRENYRDTKRKKIAEFEAQQRERQQKVAQLKAEMNALISNIESAKAEKAELEFRLDNTLSTEALYSFIERRSTSSDYEQHLGIISMIRKDFDILSTLFAGHNEELIQTDDAEDFMKHFKKPLERIVLYIDDLDRCQEKRVVEVLEAVNLLMAFPLFIVVVGVDPRWVKNALIKKYQLQFSGVENDLGYEPISPAGYLEKIFQVPFNLKTADDDSVKEMLKNLVAGGEMEITLPNNAAEIPAAVEATPTEAEEEPPGIIPGEVIAEVSVGTGPPPEELSESQAIVVPEVTIEQLSFTAHEVELIQSMSVVLGSNPRGIKRFTNIFRIIKAHADFPTDLSDDELLATMFLVAFPIGEYRNIYPMFRDFINFHADLETLASFLAPGANDIPEEFENERFGLNAALNDAQHPLLHLNVSQFREQQSLARRFYFGG